MCISSKGGFGDGWVMALKGFLNLLFQQEGLAENGFVSSSGHGANAKHSSLEAT